MAQTLRFHIVLQKHGPWYVGYIPEIPGVNAQERTAGAARSSLLAALRELAEIDPRAARPHAARIEEVRLKV